MKPHLLSDPHIASTPDGYTVTNDHGIILCTCATADHASLIARALHSMYLVSSVSEELASALSNLSYVVTALDQIAEN